MVKSVSLYRFTIFLQGQIGFPLFNLQGLQGQTSLLSSFYKVFTGSKQSDTLYRFTRISQVRTSLPFMIYNVFTESNQSLFYYLQGFLQGQISLPFSIFKVFTGPNQCLDLHNVYTLVRAWFAHSVFYILYFIFKNRKSQVTLLFSFSCLKIYRCSTLIYVKYIVLLNC